VDSRGYASEARLGLAIRFKHVVAKLSLLIPFPFIVNYMSCGQAGGTDYHARYHFIFLHIFVIVINPLSRGNTTLVWVLRDTPRLVVNIHSK
jgi:hypothetical protein